MISGPPNTRVLPGLHTIFLREHNRICDRLVKEGFRNDDIIYQMARKEVGALIQAITYQEFLPAIGINLDKYTGYRLTVRPDITNIFATAGYRIGHTMVADDIFLRNSLLSGSGYWRTGSGRCFSGLPLQSLIISWNHF